MYIQNTKVIKPHIWVATTIFWLTLPKALIAYPNCCRLILNSWLINKSFQFQKSICLRYTGHSGLLLYCLYYYEPQIYYTSVIILEKCRDRKIKDQVVVCDPETESGSVGPLHSVNMLGNTQVTEVQCFEIRSIPAVMESLVYIHFILSI